MPGHTVLRARDRCNGGRPPSEVATSNRPFVRVPVAAGPYIIAKLLLPRASGVATTHGEAMVDHPFPTGPCLGSNDGALAISSNGPPDPEVDLDRRALAHRVDGEHGPAAHLVERVADPMDPSRWSVA